MAPPKHPEDKQLLAIWDKQEKERLSTRKDSSAVGDKKERVRLSEREECDRQKRVRLHEGNDSAPQLDLSQLGWLRSISFFEPGSKLWRVLEARCRLGPESVVGCGGEAVFCEFSFDDFQTEASQKRHFAFWTNLLK